MAMTLLHAEAHRTLSIFRPAAIKRADEFNEISSRAEGNFTEPCRDIRSINSFQRHTEHPQIQGLITRAKGPPETAQGDCAALGQVRRPVRFENSLRA